MNPDDQRILEQLYVLHMRYVEEAQSRSEVTLIVRKDRQGRVSGEVHPGVVRPASDKL